MQRMTVFAAYAFGLAYGGLIGFALGYSARWVVG
jgi:hypothetical protein